MIRGVHIFGRTKKKAPQVVSSPARTPASRGVACVPPSPQPEHNYAQPPQRSLAPPSAHETYVSSPPPVCLPLAPVPRLMRLFPEYEEYDDGLQRALAEVLLQHDSDYFPLSHHEHQARSTPSTNESAVPLKGATAPVLPEGKKGLENNKGEYNCFINVVIQALWHLTAFRERFVARSGERESADHCCPGPESCVHCALQSIFAQYQFSEQTIIPPTALRKSLAVLYKNESRFQLNQIDDAAEALEAILNRLHHTERFQKERDANPSVLAKKACPCLAHNAFGVRTMDLLRCDACAATTEPAATSLFVAYAYTYALREVWAQTRDEDRRNLSFCQFFKRAAQEDRRWCPNSEKCNQMGTVEHHLLYLPKVFSVGMVWPSVNGAPVKEIEEVMDMISMQIDLSNIFITNTAIARYLDTEKRRKEDSTSTLVDSMMSSGVMDGIIHPESAAQIEDETVETQDKRKRTKRRRVKCIYELRGMICYYGQHYNCYFNSPATGQWYVFDDVMVNAVGSDWAAVKERCLRGHLQPSVLFYEKKEVIETEEDADDDSVTADSHPSAAPAKEEESKQKVRALTADDLKRTIEAEIMEMLLQGEEQWKRERERERELNRLMASASIRLDNAPLPEAQCPEEREDETTVHATSTEGETENLAKLDDAHMLQSVRIDRLSDEPEEIVDDDDMGRLENEERADDSGDAPASVDTENESDWEIIESEGDEARGNDDDDVEIIFEEDKSKDRRRRRSGRQKPNHTKVEGCENDTDEDIEIVDEEPIEPKSKDRKRYTVRLDDRQLDISFTMLDEVDGGEDSADEEFAYIDVEVTRTNWLYRRESSLYRFTRNELLQIDPYTQALQHSFCYEEMAQLVLSGSYYMIIRFKDSSKAVHHIDGHGIERIADLLCVRNPCLSVIRQ